ncbi:unnamed protein product [Blepharisma stoltei]|uniref:DDRGK domain-containing protein 1 n=1 Tax=Blepharisma stoltei TaxID=1481888 RepID=A0AAU9J640_9CILI|nr:unnamed protein product [Blepharisma stoltei]
MIIEAISVLLLTIVIGAIGFWALKQKSGPVVQPQEVEKNAKGRMNLKLRQKQTQEVEAEEKTEEDDEKSELSRREAAKLAKKEEKKAQREAKKQAYEEKLQRQNEKNAKYLEKEKEREQKEKEEEERLKKIEEEKQKKEEEEYAKWKDMFAVDEGGEEAEEAGYDLKKFIDFIKMRKVVMVEELASEFGLDGKTAVSRLDDLEKGGWINGIKDERGKYIYITEEEFLDVKKYIEKRGRVSRAELCNEGNRLVRLDPTEEDKAKIQAEERALVEILEQDDKEERKGN